MQTEKEKKAWKKINRRLTNMEHELSLIMDAVIMIFSELDIGDSDDTDASELMMTLMDPERDKPYFQLNRVSQEGVTAS